YHWIGGIMEHARGFTAITNPIVNSYKRLVPGYEAPCYNSWSDINRSTMIRIPASRGKQTRTEIRSVDSATNPYLAMSVILASGLDGIKNKIQCVDPVYINLYELDRESRESMGIKNLPENLKDAIKALRKDDIVQEALGKHTYQKFLDAKHDEWDRFRMSVTEWEIKTYLNNL
ncbi:MAG: type I glutamate--ammonia ligase, partial [Bacillota bacterium]